MFRSFATVVFLSGMLVGSAAWGATITKIIKKKRYIKIDAGTNDGFVKGAKACVFDEDGKRITCSRIRRAKKTYSYMKISKKKIKRIQKGQEVKLKEAVLDSDGSELASTAGPDKRTNFKLAYIFTVMTPATYNKLSYAAPATTSTTGLDTLWKKEEAASVSLFGVAAETEFGIGESGAIAAGLRYRFYRDFLATSDYNKEELRKFVEIEQTGTALGLYTDYTFLDIPFGSALSWRTSSGLDIDQSTVSFSATQKEDNGGTSTTIASVKSTLTVVSLRLGTNFNYMVVAPLGMTFGLNLLVPLTTFGENYSGTSDDAQQTMLADGDGSKDLKESLNHTKGSFGAEIIFAAYFAF